MKTFKAIAAIDLDNGIGKDGDLLFKIRADMQHFVKMTGTDPVIMRSGTYKSFGSLPLPRRDNYVITRDKNFDGNGATIVSSLEEAIELISENQTAWIIGGAGLYKEALSIVSELHITQIFDKKEADTFFPQFDHVFEFVDSQEIVPAKDGNPSYQFQIWKRK
tara:strand:- start:377 stop:865 length:489 start_codon:yes stop_codon:yes gene_type:complete